MDVKGLMGGDDGPPNIQAISLTLEGPGRETLLALLQRTSQEFRDDPMRRRIAFSVPEELELIAWTRAGLAQFDDEEVEKLNEDEWVMTRLPDGFKRQPRLIIPEAMYWDMYVDREDVWFQFSENHLDHRYYQTGRLQYEAVTAAIADA